MDSWKYNQLILQSGILGFMMSLKGREICELKGCHCIESCQFHLISKLVVVQGAVTKRVVYREGLLS